MLLDYPFWFSEGGESKGSGSLKTITKMKEGL